MNKPNPDRSKCHAPAPAYPEQSADGIDLSLIRANLRLTPLQRVQRADRARRAALYLREHARRIG